MTTTYAHSVTLLKDRFNQPYKLVDAYMEALVGRPSNTLSSSQVYMIYVIGKHIRALASLGKPSDSYGSLLTLLILSKFPIETKKHMACKHWNAE